MAGELEDASDARAELPEPKAFRISRSSTIMLIALYRIEAPTSASP